ncbi:MAG: SGNH/GDSL hydrolase family protein [Nocardioides sp.]
MAFHRYVALGDSFTEGVGDVDTSRPNGVRGWADRVAEVLAARARARSETFGYANLALRGRKLDDILTQQVEPAMAMRPDLITIYAGANDILRPRVDIDAIVDRYHTALGRLAGTGATLVVFTAFDPGGSATFRLTRGRFAVYNELLRWKLAAHDATVVDFWRMREYRDWRLWDPDRMHMGPAGHQTMAIKVLDTLGVTHPLRPLPLDGHADPDKPAMRNREWAGEHLAPWLLRRVRRRSSGDELRPRRPTLDQLD